MKPSPGNSQELYLGSGRGYRAGVHAHDIRFVEDDWESPTLGAWGSAGKFGAMGWKLQFTYFQQVGGLECNRFRWS